METPETIEDKDLEVLTDTSKDTDTDTEITEQKDGLVESDQAENPKEDDTDTGSNEQMRGDKAENISGYVRFKRGSVENVRVNSDSNTISFTHPYGSTLYDSLFLGTDLIGTSKLSNMSLVGVPHRNNAYTRIGEVTEDYDSSGLLFYDGQNKELIKLFCYTTTTPSADQEIADKYILRYSTQTHQPFWGSETTSPDTKVTQIGTSSTNSNRYALLLRNSTGVSGNTDSSRFSSTEKNSNPILSANGSGDLFSKSLTAQGGSIVLDADAATPTNELVIKSYSASNSTPKLRFQRGTDSDSTLDWTISHDSDLIIKSDYTPSGGTSTQKSVLVLRDRTDYHNAQFGSGISVIITGDGTSSDAPTNELVLKNSTGTAPTPKLRFQRNNINDSSYDWTLHADGSGVLNINLENPSVSSIAKFTSTQITSGNGVKFKSEGFIVDDTLTNNEYIKADGSGYGGVFTAATSSNAGSAGLVPAPPANTTDKYLRCDGVWATPSGGGGGGGSDELVIQTSTSGSTSRYPLLFRNVAGTGSSGTADTARYSGAASGTDPYLSATGDGDLYARSLNIKGNAADPTNEIVLENYRTANTSDGGAGNKTPAIRFQRCLAGDGWIDWLIRNGESGEFTISSQYSSTVSSVLELRNYGSNTYARFGEDIEVVSQNHFYLGEMSGTTFVKGTPLCEWETF